MGASGLTLTMATVWWFEGQLLNRIEKIMSALETGLRGQLAHFKRQSMQLALDLLQAKPEQEQRLLAMIVNKLGDPFDNNLCTQIFA